MLPLPASSQRLRRSILAAFSGARAPADTAIVSRRTLDPTEAAGVKTIFRGKRWEDFQNAPIELLGKDFGNSQSIFWLSPAALRYFLPVFLLACAFHFEQSGVLLDQLVALMSPDPEAPDSFEERWSELSPAQVEAVIEFLRFIEEAYGEFCGADLSLAIEAFGTLAGRAN